MGMQSDTVVIGDDTKRKTHVVVCEKCGRLLKIDQQFFADGEKSKSTRLCFNCFKQTLDAHLTPLSQNRVITNKM